MDDPSDRQRPLKNERKIVLHMLREMWLSGESSLHRIYSSWDELERNLEIITKTGENAIFRSCPNCGAKQEVVLFLEGLFPVQTCELCKRPFYVSRDLTVRKLSEDERRELPEAWVKVVEDMNKQKVAVVFKLE